MSSIHALRAWVVRTARQLFSRRPIGTRAFAALVVVALWASDASAQFTVSSSVDDSTGATANTLSWAIDQANNNPGSTINFDSSLNGVTITLHGNLPPILVNMTIDGSAVPNLKIDGAGQYSAFFVDTGTVAIKGLTIANTNSVGGAGGSTSPQGGGGGGGLGAGGALFVNNGANVTITNVSFTNNSATGGAGGNSAGVGYGGGGGGGGFHGAGGSTNTAGASAGAGGGGGGGLNGAGGSAAGLYGGSGGGGAYGTGGSSASGFSAGGGGGGGSLLPGGAGSGSNGGSGGVTGGGAGGTDGGAGPVAGGIGGGGGGGSYAQSGANGGKFGGGGGEGYNQNGGSAGQGGDFGGGGGGNRLNGNAGAGGFGGGGGGGSVFNGTPAAGGFGGGTGGTGANGGDGGDGLGGAIFVRTGGTLTIVDSGISGSSVTGGQGGGGSSSDGTAAGAALYTMSGVSATVQVTTGSQTVANSISGAGGITKSGAGTLVLSGTNDYAGGTTVSAGTLQGNTSSLQGAINNNAGVTFNQTTAGTYAGAMTGSGALTKMGSGTLTLTGANGYGGGTNVAAGTLQGDTTSLQGAITNNAAVTFNQTADGTYSGAMSGSGSLSKIGTGTLTLTGTNIFNGITEVSAGKLLVDGSTTSNTTVDQGATLGGAGTINGDVINHGNVAPGDPVTMTINGSYTQASNGNMQVAIDNLGTTPGVNSSLLIVSGTANVAGAVEVQPAGGSYALGTRYIFLEANAITGKFSGATVDSLPYTQAVLGYGTIGGFADAFFTLESNYASAAQTPNQIAVANYIDQNSGNPNLQNLVNTLNSLSAPGVRGALDQMSGALYGSVAQTDFQSTTLELSFITNRISSGLMGMGDSGGYAANNSSFSSQMGTLASTSGSDLVVRGQNTNTFSPLRRPAGNTSTWGFGYGVGGNAQGDGNAAGLNYSLGGTVAGIEAIDDNKVHGLYAGYVGSHLGSYIAGQSVGVNGGQLGFYRRVDDGRNYYILLGGMGADGYNSRRLMQFGGINTTANANYGGWQSQAYLERGVTLRGGWASIQPYAALQYLYVRQNAFTETGAGSMNLAVAGIDANSLRSLVGVRIAGNGAQLTGGRRLTPLVRALWLHEFLGTSTGLNAQFAPIGGSNFAVTGTSLGRDWAILGTGLNWNLGGGWQTYANYDAQVNVVQTFHVGSGGFQYTW